MYLAWEAGKAFNYEDYASRTGGRWQILDKGGMNVLAILISSICCSLYHIQLITSLAVKSCLSYVTLFLHDFSAFSSTSTGEAHFEQIRLAQ